MKYDSSVYPARNAIFKIRLSNVPMELDHYGQMSMISKVSDKERNTGNPYICVTCCPLERILTLQIKPVVQSNNNECRQKKITIKTFGRK